MIEHYQGVQDLLSVGCDTGMFRGNNVGKVALSVQREKEKKLERS